MTQEEMLAVALKRHQMAEQYTYNARRRYEAARDAFLAGYDGPEHLPLGTAMTSREKEYRFAQRVNKRLRRAYDALLFGWCGF